LQHPTQTLATPFEFSHQFFNSTNPLKTKSKKKSKKNQQQQKNPFHMREKFVIDQTALILIVFGAA